MIISGAGNLPDGLRVTVGAIASNVGSTEEQSFELGSVTQGSAVFRGGKFQTKPLLCGNTDSGIFGPFNIPCTPASYSVEIASGRPYTPDVPVTDATIMGVNYSGAGLFYSPPQRTYGVDITQTVNVQSVGRSSYVAAKSAPDAGAAIPLHLGAAQISTGIGVGAPVCEMQIMLTERDTNCPLVPEHTDVNIIARGIPNIVWGDDETPVEIAVPTADGRPAIGWTFASFLKNLAPGS